MRKPFVAANWKMNLTACEAEALAGALIKPLEKCITIDIAVCPAFLFIPGVARKLAGTHIALGAQDASWEEKGAFTGEIAPRMLESLVQYVIIGHSERRKKLGETDGMVNWKLVNVIKHHLTPILCVGEDVETRNAGTTKEFIRHQVTDGLKTIDLDSIEDFVVAYEPLWAIGTGASAKPAEAIEGCTIIRDTIQELYSGRTADRVRVLYGGSVNAANASELYDPAVIDGFLVGNASLQVEEFVGICTAVEMRNVK